MWRASILAMALVACASAADQPPPNLSPTRTSTDNDSADDLPELTELGPSVEMERGSLTQGGLTFWRTEPGSEAFLNGRLIEVDRDGYFVAGFGRDYEGPAELRVIFPDGTTETRDLIVDDRDFPESRITIADDTKVNPYSPEDLAQIAEERELKNAARENVARTAYWRAGFDWPVRGRISGVFGSRRIYNGEPRRPHSGVDVAAPPGMTPMEFQGTDIRAPSSGVVTLAEPDMFFEGGTIFIDHGLGLESTLLHLSRVDVRPGQVVNKGQVVGAVGMSGRATGPHLHWGLNWNGQPLDAALVVGPMVLDDE
ncbi:MAG: M23 family metallopeptidase [Pseudomonadota bacterium]